MPLDQKTSNPMKGVLMRRQESMDMLFALSLKNQGRVTRAFVSKEGWEILNNIRKEKAKCYKKRF